MALEEYIKKLFNYETIPVKVRKQIKTYTEEYNYTYSGIHKALIYAFEIKHMSLEKANGGIGIIPYIWDQSYNYFYSLWLAQQRNQDKEVQSYIPKEIIIHITPPQRKVKKRKLFSFLDEEEQEVIHE